MGSVLRQAATSASIYISRLKRLYQLLDEERDFQTMFEVPAQKRVQAYLSGFTTQSAVLYHLNGSREEYLSDFNRHIFTPEINGGWSSLFDNKFSFYQLLCTHDEHRVPVYAVFREGKVHPIEATDGSEVTTGAWLRELLKREPKVVIKPITGGGGEGVKICSRVGGRYWINGRQYTATEFETEMNGLDQYISCKFVSQAEYARKLSPGTPNTIRALTMIDPNTGDAFLARAIQRIGSERSGSVDNVSNGGLSALIDSTTGSLGPGIQYPHPDQVDSITADGPERHETHPDTGAQISGVQIPGWTEILNQLLAIAEEISYIPYAGWDIIVTDDDASFKLIEANSHTGVRAMQVHGPLLADERIRSFYECYEVI